MPHAALGLPIAYVAGSFPSAYLAGRLLKGVDLRTVGSGNLGATNVYRELGAGAALAVYLLDAGKGALPVALLPRVLDVGVPGSSSAVWWALAYGIATLAGHSKPIFLLWKGGGKGVATASGVFAALAPVPLVIALALFATVTVSSGFVSLGSLVGSLVLPPLVLWHDGATPVFWVSVAVAAFIWWSHRANIKRLLAGTENSIRRKRDGGTSS